MFSRNRVLLAAWLVMAALPLGFVAFLAVRLNRPDRLWFRDRLRLSVP